MAKPKDNEKQDQPAKEKTDFDRWREAEREARAAEKLAQEKRELADSLGSIIAKKLIDDHKGATIDLDGESLTPKKSATRTSKKDGSVKPPAYPYQLVSYKAKASADV